MAGSDDEFELDVTNYIRPEDVPSVEETAKIWKEMQKHNNMAFILHEIKRETKLKDFYKREQAQAIIDELHKQRKKSYISPIFGSIVTATQEDLDKLYAYVDKKAKPKQMKIVPKSMKDLKMSLAEKMKTLKLIYNFHSKQWKSAVVSGHYYSIKLGKNFSVIWEKRAKKGLKKGRKRCAPNSKQTLIWDFPLRCQEKTNNILVNIDRRNSMGENAKKMDPLSSSSKDKNIEIIKKKKVLVSNEKDFENIKEKTTPPELENKNSDDQIDSESTKNIRENIAARSAELIKEIFQLPVNENNVLESKKKSTPDVDDMLPVTNQLHSLVMLPSSSKSGVDYFDSDGDERDFSDSDEEDEEEDDDELVVDNEALLSRIAEELAKGYLDENQILNLFGGSGMDKVDQERIEKYQDSEDELPMKRRKIVSGGVMDLHDIRLDTNDNHRSNANEINLESLPNQISMNDYEENEILVLNPEIDNIIPTINLHDSLDSNSIHTSSNLNMNFTCLAMPQELISKTDNIEFVKVEHVLELYENFSREMQQISQFK